jgi:molybdopterin-guanine dinucleotide biosynthesis protein A
LKKAAVILAGGFSKRFGQDKCLIKLAGKPLVQHVIDRVSAVVDEKVVVVGSNAQREPFAELLKSKVNVVVDKHEGQSPLVGALTGFESVNADYSLLLPCDTPFVSSEIAALLLDLCVNKGAAIPRWPNGYIEPLQAVYHTKSAIKAAQQALNAGKRDLFSMINNLSGIRYVSTLVLQQLDLNLLTFFNVNTSEALKRAKSIIKKETHF